MSKYTTQLRYICEYESGLVISKGYNDIDTIIQTAIPSIFSFDFPIFDENYKNVLCTKILRRYYTREICEETFGLWKLRLETRLNEIMPYYNKLYESELIEFDPLIDTQLTTEHGGSSSQDVAIEDGVTNTLTRDNTETLNVSKTDDKTEAIMLTVVKNETETELTVIDKTGTIKDDALSILDKAETVGVVSNNTQKYSDTPQGALTNPEDLGYLTNVTFDNGENTKTTAELTTNNYDNTTTNDLQDTHDTSKTLVTDNDENTTRTNEAVEVVESARVNDDTETTVISKVTDKATTNTDEYINSIVGKTGGVSYSKMLQEFRKTFLNIDVMILDNLNDLFMMIW